MANGSDPVLDAMQRWQVVRMFKSREDKVGTTYTWLGTVEVQGRMYAALQDEKALHFAAYSLDDDAIETFEMLGEGKDMDELYMRCNMAFVAVFDPTTDSDENPPPGPEPTRPAGRTP